ncbi:TrbM/KikA/MpfK family conjugal transfer protein [Scandinavium goeteborgense]|uniref:TrbM protein n=1 Tax=Scandinavium goeteborgense TaxID=1851514 RepID=A0A4R6DTR5_SCAGO|nr:TrbM/KikA/MpfK family conjugal transfer protein [Scandinavium goeteborgense]TDN48064.1 TrbM protein [Scandinavium goeteborgense]
MKKLLIITVLMLPVMGYAADPLYGEFGDMADSASNQHANSDDPCTILFCMAGKAQGGSGGADCDPAVKKFMSIIKKKHGDFSPSRTANARRDKLNECPSADGGLVDKVISKFGRMR